MMDEQNMVHTHNGTLFSLKQEGNPDTGYTTWMDSEDIVLGEISQTQKEK